jgi:hypothetical protein
MNDGNVDTWHDHMYVQWFLNNSLSTIIQLIVFWCDNLSMNSLYFQGDNCIIIMIPKG